jgi:hypothetical protein
MIMAVTVLIIDVYHDDVTVIIDMRMIVDDGDDGYCGDYYW